MSANPWIRLYRDSLHNPKIVTLSDRQHRAWHNCLLIAGDDGALPSMRDIAVHMRVTVTEAEQLVCELVEAELVDVDMLKGARVYSMHGWSKRQYVSDSSAERTRKHRAKKQDETSLQRHAVIGVTPPDPDPDADADQNPDLEAREREGLKFENIDLGRGGSVSIDARRKVCANLAIGNADPLVAMYDAWSGSRTANSPDALFIASAASFYAKASADVKRACLPLDAVPTEPLPPVQASPQLAQKLKQENRRGVRTH